MIAVLMKIDLYFCNVYLVLIILIVYFQVFDINANRKERAKYVKPFNDNIFFHHTVDDSSRNTEIQQHKK